MSAAIQIRAFCGARDPAWSGGVSRQVRELARRGHVGGRARGRDPRASAGDSRGLPATAQVSGLFLAWVRPATDVSGAVPGPSGVHEDCPAGPWPGVRQSETGSQDRSRQ